MSNKTSLIYYILLSFCTISCSANYSNVPQEQALSHPSNTTGYSSNKTKNNPPDKTLAGALLGSSLGAGSGAVIGHQLSYAGEGAAIGAGFGALTGAFAGIGLDLTDGEIEQLRTDLTLLKEQNQLNYFALADLQARLDKKALHQDSLYIVYFDADASSLRSGAMAQLELIASSITKNPFIKTVLIRGHSDDGGSPDHTLKVSEARARAVAAYFQARGVSSTMIKIESLGSTQPTAANTMPEGRQLNRRVEIVLQE
jgi:outer membrane protein OmpA-like peptidoglycan-associated protein